MTVQRQEIERLRRRERHLETVVERARAATLWDFSVYEEVPDASGMAIDREAAASLLLALAGVDDWRPWHATIERRAA